MPGSRVQVGRGTEKSFDGNWLAFAAEGAAQSKLPLAVLTPAKNSSRVAPQGTAESFARTQVTNHPQIFEWGEDKGTVISHQRPTGHASIVLERADLIFLQ